MSDISVLNIDGNMSTPTLDGNITPVGHDGVSIVDVEIINNHLIVYLSDGTTIDAGVVSGGGGSYDDTELRQMIAGKVDKITGKGLSTNDYTDAEKTKLAGLSNYDDTDVTNRITTIENKIPSQASSENQLADKNFVNSSIATNTANFRGTFNSVVELEAYSGTKTINDYAFVIGTDNDGNTKYDRYKYNGTQWVFEYTLNNSSFTAVQFAWINTTVDGTTIISTNGVLSANLSDYATTEYVDDIVGIIADELGGI